MFVSRLLPALFVPVAMLGAALFVAASPGRLPAGVQGLLPMAPYVVAVLAAVLAARFHQSTAVFASVVLAMTAGAFAVDAGVGPVARAALVLAPLNLAAFSFLSERGVMTGPGVVRLGLVFGQAALVLWAADGDGTRADLSLLLGHRFAPAQWDTWTPMKQTALAALALGGAVLAVRLAMRATALDGGLLAALSAMALAGQVPAQAPLFLTAGALALAGAVVQESYRLAYMDELTGLPGRRALMTAMGKLPGRYCVAMLDVDHFKKFNDTYGHDVGDQVLQMVASRVARVTGGGKGFRYGGEEFTVLFPGRDAEGAREHLESLRAAIEASGFKLRAKDRPKAKPSGKKNAPAAKTVSVTISIGGADADSAPTPDAALKAADQNLYKAKKAGRNRVVV